MSRLPLKAYGFILCSQVAVATNIVCAKYSLGHLTEGFILFNRFSIAAILLSIFHLLSLPSYKRRKTPPRTLKDLSAREWKQLVLQGLCAGAFFNLLVLAGLNYTQANVAGIIISMLPAAIAVGSVWIMKEKLTPKTVLCVAFAVLGLMVININQIHRLSAGSLLGDLFILLALVPEAAYCVLSKANPVDLPPYLMAAVMNGFSVPVVGAFFLWTGHLQDNVQSLHASNVLVLLLMGISSGMFYGFWQAGIKHIHASTAGLFTAFSPLATMLIAWLALNERMTELQVVGMGLVLISIGFNALSFGRAKGSEMPEAPA